MKDSEKLVVFGVGAVLLWFLWPRLPGLSAEDPFASSCGVRSWTAENTPEWIRAYSVEVYR